MKINTIIITAIIANTTLFATDDIIELDSLLGKQVKSQDRKALKDETLPMDRVSRLFNIKRTKTEEYQVETYDEKTGGTFKDEVQHPC